MCFSVSCLNLLKSFRDAVRSYTSFTLFDKNSFNAYLWQQAARKATVTIDMMWYGILLYDKKLQKGRYNLII